MQKQMHTAINTATIILWESRHLHTYLSRTFLRLTLLVSLWIVGKRFPKNDILLRLLLSRMLCCRKLDWELNALLAIIPQMYPYSKYESAIRIECVAAFISFSNNWVSVSSWFLYKKGIRLLRLFVTTRKQLHACHLPRGILLPISSSVQLHWDKTVVTA